MEKNQKILLSGIKPTGVPHIGNYFGMMKQVVNLQNDYEESLVFVADYHALNTIQNAKEMRQNIFEIALDYLAIGLDPKKITVFKQSDIPQHTELAIVFNAITTIPFFAENDEIDRLAMSIITDSKGVKEAKDAETDNVFALHKLFSGKELADIKKRYEKGENRYRKKRKRLGKR